MTLRTPITEGLGAGVVESLIYRAETRSMASRTAASRSSGAPPGASSNRWASTEGKS